MAPRQGDRVAAGEIVARQERADAEIALAEAEAAREEAAAELANLREGSRPEEIRVTEASLEAAQVRFREAERQAERQTELNRRGVVPQADLDTTIAARDTARTEVAELEAQLAVERLPARAQLVAAAESRLRGAEAAVREAALAAREARPRLAGRRRRHRRLPPRRRDRRADRAGPLGPARRRLQARRLRRRGRDRRASRRAAALDGALRRLPGRADRDVVSYVSDEPEFTPPVIYSVENRQKLVYRVEARPPPAAGILRPGQIVDVGRAEP